ncbi:uncharacterized protein RSE6_03447 [Rhynchosporium secalis]|uniref:Uncharacterized protein n=1 Tax=Rhynchosporium secalis TaxID=38038 RepID=A0A1E1M2S8_RHYSE|nr:uncharacterized protein RSE6_03447 [Rhynchosporium secalis]
MERLMKEKWKPLSEFRDLEESEKKLEAAKEDLKDLTYTLRKQCMIAINIEKE